MKNELKIMGASAVMILALLGIVAYAFRWLWFAMIAVAMLLMAYSSARAHSWYDPACCSGEDCRPVPAEELIETETGWKHLPTGIEFTKDKVKPSKDRHFHICVSKAGFPYCIYILQGT